MKRILTAIALFGASALVMLTSCQKPEQGKEDGGTETVEFRLLSSPEMTFPYEGGTDTIFYELKNAVADGVIEVTPADGWAGSFDVSTEGEIVFSVSENTATEERNCTLRVSYLYGENSSLYFDVAVKQNAAEDVPPVEDAFTITVDNEAYATADCNVVPKDPEMPFISMVVKKSIVEKYLDDQEAWFEEDMLIFSQQATMYGLAFQDYVENYKLNYGTLDYRASGLTPSTEYWCYAYGMEFDDNGDPVMLTAMVLEGFTTETPDSDPDEFILEVSAVGSNGIQLLVIPYSDDVLYYYDNIREESLVEYTGTMEERLEQYSCDYIQPWINSGMYTIEDFGWYGSQAKTFWNILPGKTYYAFAYILESDGSAKDGKVWYQEYTMESLAGAPVQVMADAVRPENVR